MPFCLIDTSFLVASIDATDRYHNLCLETASQYTDIIIPTVMLTEATYLIRKYSGENAVLNLLDKLASTQPPLVDLTYGDFKRIREIRQRYRSANFDFVDCCIMAMAARLNISHICTLDGAISAYSVPPIANI